ncbi:uncharacterized protein [Henckelia pumila]|uniref:uncharacterized protein n=1 Tax=Henckelia pumila TaxID=405737 RepID=UPI003C6DF5B5
MNLGAGSSNTGFIGSCHYNGELYMISISNPTTLMELFFTLSRKCVDMRHALISLQYQAPHEKIFVTLNEDDDVATMLNLHTCLKLTIIDMRAVRRNDSSRGNRQYERIGLIEENTGSTSESQMTVHTLRNSLDSWSHCIRGEGQTFKDATKFRVYLKSYAVATRRSFLYKKNDSVKVIVVCSDSNCNLRIYASKHKSDNLFGIRKCNLEHSCGEDHLRSRGHPRADSSWVANVVKDKLRAEPLYRSCEIIKDIHLEYGVELESHRAWMGKELAMHDIHGTDKGAYGRLHWYCNAVKETNPGSFADCEIDDVTQKFQRLFICLNACVVGFVNGCRPFLFLDGTHIKNKYKGCILAAVTKYGNDDLFTLAYAVVDAENDKNWLWFCYKLRQVLLYNNVTMFDDYTFFSDRHPGIIKAIESVFPSSHHAYCLRHLVDNFVKQVMRRYPLHNKKHWSSVFKKAAYAYSRQDYVEHINSIIESMPNARDFIINSQPQCWANSLFPGNRWGVINNNIAECWNSWVKAARFLSIVPMVDHIRKKIMNMMHQRRETSLVLNKELTPEKEKLLVSICINYRSLKVDRSSNSSFEVVEGDKTYAVDLKHHRCSCRAWQVLKLPCKHACAAIESKSLSFYDFCDKYYTTRMYRETYRATINPIPTFDMYESQLDEDDVIYAPDSRSHPGHRRTKRFPSQIEIRTLNCGRCHRKGHNRRTCKESLN